MEAIRKEWPEAKIYNPEKLTPFTARTTPSSVGKTVWMSLSSMSGVAKSPPYPACVRRAHTIGVSGPANNPETGDGRRRRSYRW